MDWEPYEGVVGRGCQVVALLSGGCPFVRFHFGESAL